MLLLSRRDTCTATLLTSQTQLSKQDSRPFVEVRVVVQVLPPGTIQLQHQLGTQGVGPLGVDHRLPTQQPRELTNQRDGGLLSATLGLDFQQNLFQQLPCIEQVAGVDLL